MNDEFTILMYELYWQYQNLLEAEKKRGIGTKDFEEELMLLKMFIKREENSYIMAHDNLKNLVITDIDNNFAREIKALLDGSESNLVGIRVALKTMHYNKDSLFEKERMLLEIKNDFMRTLLYFINEYLENPKYQQYRDFLLQVKYNISYLFPDLENNLVAFDMQINPNLYWLSEGLATFDEMNLAEYEQLKSRLLNISYDLALDSFSSCSFYDKKNAEHIFFYYLILRSTIIFFTKEEVDNIRKINQFLNDFLHNQDTPYSKMLTKLCAINEQDSLIPAKISLKK